MDNQLNAESRELKITPKSELYFMNKLLNNTNTKNPVKISSSIQKKFENNKYFKINNLNSKINSKENNTISNFYKSNDKLIKQDKSLSSYKYKENNKKDFGCVVHIKLKNNKHLKSLNKNFDFYSPKYQRLFSGNIIKEQNRIFNQNYTYDKHIKTNIKNFLFSEKEDKEKKEGKKILNSEKIPKNNNSNSERSSKNNKISSLNGLNNYLNTTNKKKIMTKKINYIKKRPKSTIIKYIVDNNFKNRLYQIEYLYNKKERPNSINYKKQDKYMTYQYSLSNTLSNKNNRKNNRNRVNIINFSFQLNKLSKIFKKNIEMNKDKLYNRYQIRNISLSKRNNLFNQKTKIIRNKKKTNISFSYDDEKKSKNKIYYIKYN